MFKVFGFYKFVQVKSLKKNKFFLQKFLISNHIRGTIIIAKEGLNGTISGNIKDIDKTTKKLNGMWAFACFDRKRNILTLSRDRFGEKPLYYFIKDDFLIFSSAIQVGRLLKSLTPSPRLPVLP